MRKSYVYRLLSRAVQLTKDDVGLVSPRAAGVHALLAFITLMVIYHNSGLDNALDEINNWWLGTLAVITWASLVFCWNLILAPSSLQHEADDKIVVLTARLDTRANWQEKLDKLWTLRSEGISLRNEHRFSKISEFGEWRRRIEDWRERIETAARDAEPNFQKWIHHLDITVANPGIFAEFHGEFDNLIVNRQYEVEHDRQVRMVSTVLDRTARYLLKEFVTTQRFDE